MLKTDLLDYWRFRIHRVQLAHYECARHFERLHLWLGLPAVALSTLVGTTIFASLSKTTDIALQIGVGLLSVVAAVLTGLQTFLRYSELAEKHRLAGARFANLKHRIELLSTFPPANEGELNGSLQAIEEVWSKLREESPMLPGRIWRRIEQTVRLGAPFYPESSEKTPLVSNLQP
jgi:hypothetical protein